MKEVILTRYDIQTIKDAAHKLYIDKAAKDDSFVGTCWVEATISFITAKKLIVKDGKLYAETKADK